MWWTSFFALSACQIVSSSLFCQFFSRFAYRFGLYGPPTLSKIPPRCDTAVTVLSWKDIVVQVPEDSSWYAESMKTAGTVNN